MTGTTLLREPPTARLGAPRAPEPPVLIQVPSLSESRPKRGRGASASGRFPTASRSRRRLRREVKAAGVAALVGGSLVAGFLLVRASPIEWTEPGHRSTDGDGFEATGEAIPGDAFEISLEKPEPLATESPESVDLLSITFSGHLLPDDGDEENGHARH